MLTWPHADSDWCDVLDTVNPVFAQIGHAIARHEILLSVCASADHLAEVRHRLVWQGADQEQLRFGIAPGNDTWARDHGPLTTLRDQSPAINDFVFNGWGGKFSAELDSAVTGQLHEQGTFADAALLQHDLVLEGGALETDGAGTLLATRSSIVTTSRNAGLDTRDIEQRLTEILGLRRFLWLEHGDLSGDDTDGHIDTLARFADPETILFATAPAGDPDRAALSAMAAELQHLRRADGQPYRLLALPFPGIHLDHDGRRLPASYANFLVINDAVLLPTYRVPQDDEAMQVIRKAFPTREVVGIDCREIIRQNGSLHCLTMQFPQALELRNGAGTTKQ